MTTKLTLRLDEELIQAAKNYSKASGKSLSRIVSDLFILLRNERLEGARRDSPSTRSLKGVLKNQAVSEEEYRAHLKNKYL